MMAPSFFKPKTEKQLADLLVSVAKIVPHMPLYYYHIPFMNGVDMHVEKVLNMANALAPNVIGCKYTGQDFEKYSKKFFKKYNFLVGQDPMLYEAFLAGADGAIGIGFNFMGNEAFNVYHGVKNGDLVKARRN